MDGTTSPLQATSLDALPVAVQNYLAFRAIVAALGFDPSAIGHRVKSAPAIERAAEQLYATLTANGKEFAVDLGAAVPAVEAWLARAGELWASAAPAARDALYDRSSFFQGNRFAALVTALERGAFPPPIAPGLVVSRLERAGIAAAVRRSGTLDEHPPAVARTPRASATPTTPRPVGPPRFELGTINYLGKNQLPGGELAPLLQRHASGDWGESRYAEDNEAALRSGRPILSVFRSAVGQQVLLITFSHPTRTSVWLQAGVEWPEEVLLDLVCRHVGTGRRTEIPRAPRAPCTPCRWSASMRRRMAAMSSAPRWPC